MAISEPPGLPAFDALTEAGLREGRSLKWTRYGTAIGAFVAEMDFGTAPVVTRSLSGTVERGQLGYLTPEAAADMARACAGWQARRYGWEVPPAWITPLADVVAGLQAAIERFTPPGTPIVLPTPAYMPFLAVPGALGRELIQVPMVDRAGRMGYDLDGIAAAFDRGARLVVHVNPHNPLGRVFAVDEQLALADVVSAAGARVFADEIHAPLVYPGATHRPYASLSPETARHTVTATSTSKAWNVPGLKTAQLILSNAEDAEHWARVGFLYGHGASTPGVLAATAAYDEGAQWLDDVLAYLDGNRRFLAELLAERLPQVGYTPPEGTYLAWLDCRRLGLEGSAGAFFLDRGGVALVDGPECGPPGAGHVRLNFATPRPVLTTIVERMAAAVGAR
ncbi:aminotransferase class I/II-fold pyridoxal phosphate-dependent enzyme [Blastococcus sp. CT_GayMR16]|uniref:MalY/PatB family protein n=1 Tax=Blastococcus sp. CT_GayMR16 TaxID=2559607 RepID=UPI001074520C|nr:aminotransferase class I/II-fold pyridoxal phosphate-dependent enzyme [Blastococcus sp. CT_GayMR16]TFV85847.1 aminotransferase class I/II-fold pyridoxal phosphate-dependent enzyme [Blastococcus sp. CT_GayMR16]